MEEGIGSSPNHKKGDPIMSIEKSNKPLNSGNHMLQTVDLQISNIEMIV